MYELVQQEQPISIVPNDFKWANKGEVEDISEKWFSVKMKYPTTGLKEKEICEFYSQTNNGILYFESYIKRIEDGVIFVDSPIKHKFLQRRKFTRIKFLQELLMQNKEDSYEISTLDLSAGGMKFKTRKNINIENDYKISVPLSDERIVDCKFQPIRIQKDDDGFFTISGRFKNLSNVDKMTLIQFCMKKNMENVNK